MCVRSLRHRCVGCAVMMSITLVCLCCCMCLLQDVWAEGLTLAMSQHFKFPSMVSNNLKNLVRNAGEEGLQLMQHLLMWDPQKRPTAAQVRVCVCARARVCVHVDHVYEHTP